MIMYFKRLEELRKDSDLTQLQVAEHLHLKREVYRRYEKGIHEPPVWVIISLAGYYNVTTDYLLGLTDERIIPGIK